MSSERARGRRSPDEPAETSLEQPPGGAEAPESGRVQPGEHPRVDERPGVGQLVGDEPWDEAWLPQWVSDAGFPAMGTGASVEDESADGQPTDGEPTDAEPTDGELTGGELTGAELSDEARPDEVSLEVLADEPSVTAVTALDQVVPSATGPRGTQDDEPGPVMEPVAEAGPAPEPADQPVSVQQPAAGAGLDADASEVAEPVSADTAPGRRPLPPRIGAALAELREAQLAAERAAEEQAAAQLAAWEEAIRAGEELAERAASSPRASTESSGESSAESSAAPSGPLSHADDVPPVPTAPTEARRRHRVLLALAVLLVAGLLAGFSFTGSPSGDRAEVAAAERDAGAAGSLTTAPRTSGGVLPGGRPVDPLAGIVHVDVLPDQPFPTASTSTAPEVSRPTTPSTTAGTTSGHVRAPVTPAVPTGVNAGLLDPGTDGTGTAIIGTEGAPPANPPTDGVPAGGDGTGPGSENGQCPTGATGSDSGPDGEAGTGGGTDPGAFDPGMGAGDPGTATGSDPVQSTGEVAAACAPGAGGGEPGGDGPGDGTGDGTGDGRGDGRGDGTDDGTGNGTVAPPTSDPATTLPGGNPATTLPSDDPVSTLPVGDPAATLPSGDPATNLLVGRLG